MHSNENDNDYYIESTSGTTYPLNLALCGVHIGKFCRALEKIGVKHELRVKRLRKKTELTGNRQ